VNKTAVAAQLANYIWFMHIHAQLQLREHNKKLHIAAAVAEILRLITAGY